MYSVNGSVPKTMVRRIVEVYSERDRLAGGTASSILDDILATPVSPELLPPKDGEIAQCTEALVGPYELHDYFLYMMLREKMGPADIYYEAKHDFAGVYDNKTILGWLRVFVRRFFSQQFKRSCLPDGPQVSCISVSPRCGLFMPSDASAAVWLEELNHIEEEEK
jgi:NAD+ synthase (glutamine-hydrolysing)